MALLTLVGITLLLCLLLYRYIIFPTFLSPLSKIPNAHFSSPILPLWIWSKRRNGTGVRTLLALHQKHGSVVRLAPNEISINSAEALRTVYTGGFEKHHWYRDTFVNYDTLNLFTMLQHKPHSVRKRMLANVYSKSYLQNSEDLQKASAHLMYHRFLPIMADVIDNKGGELDVLDFMQGVGMDFTSAYLFGLPNGTDFMNDARYRQHWLDIFKTFKIQLPKQRVGGEIERWCLAMCEAAERSLHSDPAQTPKEKEEKEKETSSTPTTHPVVFARLTQSLQTSQPPLSSPKPPLRTAASEMLDHLVAGHETSGITLTYLTWELSRHPTLQTQLRTELLTLDPPILIPPNPNTLTTPPQLPPPRSIDTLPLLDALLLETLRLYTATPGPQPRLTPSPPPGTSTSTSKGTGTTIPPYPNIPPSILISASPYVLHRHPTIFPSPESWLPERWTTSTSSAQIEEMKRWFWAFSSGGRMCLGSHFAIMGALGRVSSSS